MLRSVLAVTILVLASAVCGAGCRGKSIRAAAPTGPQLASDRLGSVRSVLTCDGDWMGGVPLAEDLEEDLDLAHRRGVTTIIDLRGMEAIDTMPLDAAAENAAMELVVINRALAGDTLQEMTSRISNAAVDATRELLAAPERDGILLFDDGDSLAAAVYAIYLTVDRHADEGDVLKAARSSGISDDDAAFVREQVARISR